MKPLFTNFAIPFHLLNFSFKVAHNFKDQDNFTG